MCGIAGALGGQEVQKITGFIVEIIKSQTQRGPDFNSVQVSPLQNGHVVLGHNRLSIIDLSSNANQPMWDIDKRVSIVFNGEIYNYIELRTELQNLGHRFYTLSDTEVILEAFKAWGIKVSVNKFNGMFAFALFDKNTEKLWLVRDRFGVKPLYYHTSNNEFYFASTGKVIAERLGLQPNLEYVARGLKYWIYEDESDISQYEELCALPAAHLLEVEIKEDRIKMIREKYYDLEEKVQEKREQFAVASHKSLFDLVQEGLDNSIDLRLRSDVPIGISLSGGLDSSTIAALLSRKHNNIKGFTFSHPDILDSEGPLVAELVRKINSPIEYIWTDPKNIHKVFWDTLQAQDAPFAGESIIAQNEVFRTARADGIRVMLGGQGGDELFMGYRKFQLFRFRQLLSSGEFFKAAVFAFNMLSLLSAETSKISLYWSARTRYSDPSSSGSDLVLPLPRKLEMGFNGSIPLWKRQVHDITKFSLPTLLRYEDRNSMGNSIESRLPFLDYKLLETAIALPESLKLRHGHGKWILREIMANQIPENIRLSKLKRGFDVNNARWIESGMGAFLRNELSQRREKIGKFLKSGFSIEKTYSDQAFKRRKIAFAEVVSLLWLATKVS